uniref:Si:ch211-222n4.2 n=1 Tax=Myripristis murdjan TaxID=586833 RepID=A0A667XCQ4_9TELE
RAAPGQVSPHTVTDTRVASLKRDIQFLQEQHKDTLQKLHAEVDYLRRENKGESHNCTKTLGSSRYDFGGEPKGGLITSLQPLRIHSSPTHPPRAPTLEECEVIIRQLYNANSMQSQEVSREISPACPSNTSKENVRIASVCFCICAAQVQKSGHLGVLLKSTCFLFPRSAPRNAGVTLPALKQSLSSSIAERQRRSQAVQRTRLKRTVQ